MVGTRFLVRDVNFTDSQNLLSWRNDPTVIKFLQNSRTIDAVEHTSWLSERLQLSADLPFLAFELEGHVVGYVRLDISRNKERLLSILVSPKFRGCGFGRAILSTFLLLVRSRGNLGPIVAYVHKENIPSQRLFRSLSFKEENANKGNLMRFVCESTDDLL